MSVKSQSLREERSKLVADAQALLRKEGGLQAADKPKFDAMMDRADELGKNIEAEERAEQREKATAEQHRVFDAFGARNETKAEREYRTTWNKFMKYGTEFLTNEERRSLIEKRTTDSQGQYGVPSGITYTGGSAGGYFVPAGFQYEIDQALKYYCPFLTADVCRKIETASGAILPFPTGDDVSNVATIVGANTQVNETPVAVGVQNFGAYKYTSNVIRVALELMQDSAFNIEDYLRDRFAERFGRGLEAAFTVGTGGGAAPTGIVPAVLASGVTPVVSIGSSGNDGTGAAATSIGSDDLVNLEHSVDPMYRRRGKFMLHDQVLKNIKQLKDKYGRPLWLPGLSVNAPDTILGYPYVINQSMASSVASTQNTVLFGDMSHYVIREVKDMSVLKLVERYADYGQVGFVAFGRWDGQLVDAGTHPINILQQHS